MKRMFEEKSTKERCASKKKERNEERMRTCEEAATNKKMNFELLVRVSSAK
eukprot:CAMPEP_0176399638 /NCGR_PEP_ID=MMETSP0126-20121128/46921_1 /TAXON_ID=141414 ORGANISM="Strombidinopsis acuminatum, Strain SPMC142" /NCGR_SAMPLE_ID=MMETSP0126 /ASSEMBLY_ACC=CAM_ASM_000229 /LENGTH=50 /DNA_ID=CAMNT_0017775341 /DNA_START=13 /DNA_END=165 /DNA_ORIENTATION=+